MHNNIGDIMIDNYEMKNINGEERLYLYFNIDMEFFDFKEKKENIELAIKKFIKDNKIAFKGTVATLIVGGVIVGNIIINKPKSDSLSTLYTPNVSEVLVNTSTDDKNIILLDGKEEVNDNIKKEKSVENIIESEDINVQQEDKKIEEKKKVEFDSLNINNNTSTKTKQNVSIKNLEQAERENDDNKMNIEIKEELSENKEISKKLITEERKEEVDNNFYVIIKRGNGITLKIELEEYLIGVVGAEMPASFNIEALKLQAVVARTYALKTMKSKGYLTDTSSTQNYKDNHELQNMWGNSYNTYYNKVKGAVDSTKGIYLTYNGNYIDAVYHSTSNGKTESSNEVWGNYFPYLVSVDSIYDNNNPSFSKTVFFTYEELSSRLNVDISIDTEFNIISKTEGDRVGIISIGSVEYKGVDFRNKLGLRSADFEIEKTDGGVNIITKGYGHGVGMSQYGANGLAKVGYNYQDILKHYYTNVVISHL